MPAPGVPAHICQCLLCLPAQLLRTLSRICIAGGQVAGSAIGDLIRHRHLVDGSKGVYHIQHAIAGAGSQIKNLATAILVYITHSRHMALCKIHHMDIVTDTGAIGSIIIVAEDRKLFPSAYCHLG